MTLSKDKIEYFKAYQKKGQEEIETVEEVKDVKRMCSKLEKNVTVSISPHFSVLD